MHARALLFATTAILAALCVALFCWLQAGERSGPSTREQADLLLAERERERPAIEAGPADPAAEEPVLAGAPTAQRRPLGWVAPDPDSLHVLKGRVIDAETERPVAGLELSLMSPRPKNCTVVTDAQGRFETGRELAAGVIAALHVPDEQELRFRARWELLPGQFLLPAAPEGSASSEVTLRARRPETVLEVEVSLPDGLPAAGASVSLTAGRRDAQGLFEPLARDYEVADAGGRARFPLFGDEAFEQSLEIEAEHQASYASEVLLLDPPITGRPQKLDLQPGGNLRVRVRNDQGSPVAGLSLWASQPAGARSRSGRHGTTDAAGEASFAALRAGCWTIDVVHPLTGASLQKEVELTRSASAEVEFLVGVADLERGVSGVVLDEDGVPLAGTVVRVHAAGDRAVEIASGPEGQFEFWSRPVESLSIAAGLGFLDDEFEPAFTVVPFGATGVEIRRRVEVPTYSLPFVVVDPETGAPIEHARITLHHGKRGVEPGSPAQRTTNAVAGVAQVTFKLRDDTRWTVDAPGRLRASGRLAELCETFRDRGSLRVELERGFERRVVVKDRVTRRALAGAVLGAGARVFGTTEASGALLLRASEWPPSVRVECTGYQALLWDPAAAPFPGEEIWLEPLRNRQ